MTMITDINHDSSTRRAFALAGRRASGRSLPRRSPVLTASELRRIVIQQLG